MDVTQYADGKIAEMKRISENPPKTDWTGLGVVLEGTKEGDSCFETDSEESLWEDAAMMIAATLSRDIRQAVFDELGYTCSAGVSINKTLSKLCSGLNKPNNQTILHSTAIDSFMYTLPFQKIR